MKIQLTMRVNNTFASQKGRTYIEGADIDTGGKLKVSVPGQLEIPFDAKITYSGEMETSMGRDGSLYLTLVDIAALKLVKEA